jgi:nucleoid-associated protein YgaU
MATPEKAYIESVDGAAARVEFAFNPKEFKISRKLKVKRTEQKGTDVPQLEFKSGQGRKLTFELFFDEYESGGSVRDAVEKLDSLAVVDSSTEGAAKKARPPFVRFGWGRDTFFKSIVKSVDATYTLFHPDGRPARAKVKVQLEEVPDEPAGQNPTSGGEPGLRSHMVLPGETLDVIAYRELGDSRHWKHIAELNGVDDPWSLRPGQRLVVAQPE